jgi:hypothetical protein
MQVEDPVNSGGDEERQVTARERYLREAYGAIRRKEERSKATPPFGFTQGHEPVEWQMMP